MNTQHQVFRKLLARVGRMAPLPTAVVHPCDSESLRGALDAARRRLIKPILVGPAAKIHRVAKATGLNIRKCELIPTEHSHAAAEAAVALARTGHVECLMKGSLHTAELMAAVVATATGLRTERRIKHIKSEVAGRPDNLVVPDLECGNMLVKQLQYLAGAKAAGIVLGARVPIARRVKSARSPEPLAGSMR